MTTSHRAVKAAKIGLIFALTGLSEASAQESTQPPQTTPPSAAAPQTAPNTSGTPASGGTTSQQPAAAQTTAPATPAQPTPAPAQGAQPAAGTTPAPTTTPPPAPPAVTQTPSGPTTTPAQTPPVTTPPVTQPATPGAPSAAPAPTDGTAPGTTPVQPGTTTTPGTTGQQLPDVDIIQAAPEPPPQTPEAPQPPKIVKKKPAPVETEPDPEPVVVQTKPKAKPQPKPQQAQSAPKPKPAQQKAQPAPAPEPVAQAEPAPAPLPAPVGGPPAADTQVKVSPLAGSEIPLAKVPGAVGVVSSADVSRSGTGQVQNALQQQVPGIILSDTAGSGFRTDVSYRGFDASPIGGRSQALAVYFNGIRINESFGDTVNFDAIPSIAISDIAVVGNNPVFGLNAIGGAISISAKDGFEFQGATIDVMGGSFGRVQVAAEAGGKSGNFAAYAAGEFLQEDGFRDFSAAEVKRMYADLGYKDSAVEIHMSLNAAKSLAGVVTAAPVDLLNLDWGRTFTSPQDTEYSVLMPSLRGSVKATETLTISGLAYYRRFKQNVLDGNLSAVDECAPGPNARLLCLSEGGVEEVVEDASGNPVLASAVPGPIGSLERINQDARSYGGTAQAVEKAEFFGRPNQFVVGVSYDQGRVGYQTSSELGTIGDRFVVTGSGIIVVEPDDLEPRDLIAENRYVGLYFSNTLDITDDFALTVGGRYNHATIKLTDLTGNFDELNTTNKYDRFNPQIGATYKLGMGLSLYGGYSEANRAPTAAELGCAEPENPCLIESFLTDDPPLKQVISRSVEAGIRGEHKSWDSQKLTWSLGYFRTLNTDDILNVAATSTGRGYFLNAGDTLRQGLEAAIGYQNRTYSVSASYALIDATFRDDLVLPAPNTPTAELCPNADPADPDAPTCNFVSSGDHLPGIPKHRLKMGIEYWLTPQWKVGSEMVAASSQFFFGDEANNNRKLAGYARVDLSTTYDLNENVQFYGLVKNVFDRRYGLFGTFFDTEEATDAAEPQGLTLTDPRSITPAQPVAVYGGVKVKF